MRFTGTEPPPIRAKGWKERDGLGSTEPTAKLRAAMGRQHKVTQTDRTSENMRMVLLLAKGFPNRMVIEAGSVGAVSASRIIVRELD